jgi:arylsulfatase A-like enzyme
MVPGQFSRRQFPQTAAAGALAATSSDRPNIIFLMADEHRYDAPNCLGNSNVHSPNLDRMASQGVRFTRTYCQGPLCQPSRVSIMTGRYPDGTNYHRIEKLRGCAWVRWIQ